MNLEQKLLDRFYKGKINGISEEIIKAGVEVSLKDWFLNPTDDKKSKVVLKNKKATVEDKNQDIIISMVYDSSEDFQPDYFHYKSCITDGTCLFMQGIVLAAINTVYEGIPKYLIKQIDNIKSIEYTFGNAFITTEYGDFGTKEKPWLHERIACWLPIKFNYTLKEGKSNE